MYKAIYREYRPEVFSSMLGQDHIVRILENQIAGNSVSHAYLFCGTRGTGKTTTARLLAKAVNCLSDDAKPCGVCANCQAIKEGNFVDLIELDAASNNGINDIRELRESVEYAPVVGKKKVYIIDEVHMLSTSAFNALLKTLEEPPATVMFILCTTEPEKLPATILSRCMRMDFRRVSEGVLIDAMKNVCEDKNVTLEDGALLLIAANADGSVRDCMTLLEQCIAGRQGSISREDVLSSLGMAGEESYVTLTEAVMNGDTTGGILHIASMLEQGLDARQILRGWMNHYRNLMLTKFLDNPQDSLNMSLENVERIERQAQGLSMDDIDRAIMEITKTLEETRLSSRPRILLEVCFVRLATAKRTQTAFTTGSNISKGPERDNNSAGEKPSLVQIETEPKTVEKTTTKVAIKAVEKKALPKEEKAVEHTQEVHSLPQQEQQQEQLEELWDRVLDKGEQQLGGMFNLVRANVQPMKINDKELAVLASGLAAGMLEQHKYEIEEFVAQVGGRPRRLVIKDETDSKEENTIDAESLAKEIRTKLGVAKVDIVDE